MKKVSIFLSEKRNIILIIMSVLLIVSLFFISKVNINYDMTNYLPKDSDTRIGMDIIESEFSDEDDSSLNIMFEDLTEEEKLKIQKELSEIENVSRVDYELENDNYNKDNYTLYTIHVADIASSIKAKEVYETITDKYQDETIYLSGSISEVFKSDFTPILIVAIIIVIFAVLFVMSNSWFEPFLFITSIIFAIVLNMGTNAIFESVSSTTNSIVALLQLVLSMDYSVMLINRYRQEKSKEKDKIKAMKKTIYNSFKSILSSSITTIAGLLLLVFMSFTIGRDIGLVLAKGVLFSLLCVFTVLPALIIFSDKLLEKTKKKSINIKFNGLSNLTYKLKYPILVLFIIILCSSFLIKNNVDFAYTLNNNNKIEKIFPSENKIVVLYKNEYQEDILKYITELQTNDKITNINDYGTTLGIRMSASDLAKTYGIDESLISQIYGYYFMENNTTEDDKIVMYDLINFIIARDILNNENFKPYITNEVRTQITDTKEIMDSSLSMLVGKNYSRMILTTTYDEESNETTEFLKDLESNLPEDSYIIGNSALVYEMSKTFKSEFNFISILTAVVIFIIVAISFKSLIIPLILVAVIQTSIYLLMTIMSITDFSMYYLALLIVQGILMGATIDYAILYTSYYKESRIKNDVKEGIRLAYEKSSHSIFTSSLILIGATLVAGLLFENPTVGNICLVISLGSSCALVLILFILPSLLCIADKFTSKIKS